MATKYSSARKDSPTKDNIAAEIESQFLSCVPSKCFLTEKLSSYVVDNVDEILKRTVYHKLNRKYPVKRSHQISFLKTIMNMVEARNTELSPDVYAMYLSLLDDANRSDEFHYVHYCVNRRYISMKQKSNMISNGTTGLSIWQAGIILAQYCSDNCNEFANKRIIELGSGLGFTGIATIMNCEPQYYCFTDTHERVLEQMMENIEMNLGECLQRDEDCSNADGIVLNATYKNKIVSVLNFAWETEIPKYYADLKPDFILAADVTYDPASFDSFCSCLRKLMLTNDASKTFLACTVRNEDTLKQFFECLHEHDLREKLISTCCAWNSSFDQKLQVQIFLVIPCNRIMHS